MSDSPSEINYRLSLHRKLFRSNNTLKIIWENKASLQFLKTISKLQGSFMLFFKFFTAFTPPQKKHKIDSLECFLHIDNKGIHEKYAKQEEL